MNILLLDQSMVERLKKTTKNNLTHMGCHYKPKHLEQHLETLDL